MDGRDRNDLIQDLNIFLQEFAVEPLTLVLLACCCWGGPMLRICCRVNVPCHTSKKLCLELSCVFGSFVRRETNAIISRMTNRRESAAVGKENEKIVVTNKKLNY